MDTIPVVDLFAGPGGLNEGFSAYQDASGVATFQTVISIERDKHAHQTLRLRSFYRKIANLSGGEAPAEYLAYLENPSTASLDYLKSKFPQQWQEADQEALLDELSDENDYRLIAETNDRLRAFEEAPVIIGGPPCQAYSLVGRARRTNDPTLIEDEKQTLYKSYLRFIEHLEPQAFVMENVKGMLTAQSIEGGVFSLIRRDIDDLGYDLYSLVEAEPARGADYIVRAENYGIPQARHRVILLGVRKGAKSKPGVLQPTETRISVREVLAGLPKLRSGFSRRAAAESLDWGSFIHDSAAALAEATHDDNALRRVLERVAVEATPSVQKATRIDGNPHAYESWYRGDLRSSRVVTHHESRTHIAEDLKRYLFSSSYTEAHGHSPKLADFPPELLPNHKNVTNRDGELQTVVFGDRFKTQLATSPSTTITSHISKDGHYYIHPDPAQCRSLTPREAARLQTFPDSYFFMGNRTQSYHQIGNAVPPLLAKQIAGVLADFLKLEHS